MRSLADGSLAHLVSAAGHQLLADTKVRRSLAVDSPGRTRWPTDREPLDSDGVFPSQLSLSASVGPERPASKPCARESGRNEQHPYPPRPPQEHRQEGVGAPTCLPTQAQADICRVQRTSSAARRVLSDRNDPNRLQRGNNASRGNRGRSSVDGYIARRSAICHCIAGPIKSGMVRASPMAVRSQTRHKGTARPRHDRLHVQPLAGQPCS